MQQDLQKALHQIRVAREILSSDPQRTLGYVRSWFPEMTFPNSAIFELRGGIVLSVREYSGLMADGIPVRDVFSLRGTLLSGEVRSVVPSDEGGRDQAVFRYWKGDKFTHEDFLAYWGPSPPALSIFEDSLVEFSNIYQEEGVTRVQHQYALDTWHAIKK